MTAVLQDQDRREGDDGPSALQTADRLRLLVVDDHAAVREGLRGLLGDQIEFLVVASVSSAEEAFAITEQTRIDVVVTDYQLGGRNGIWLSRKVKRLPEPPKVVIYSAYCDGLLAAAAVVADADGLVDKGGLGSELTDAVRAVSSGRTVLPMVPLRLAEVIRRRLNDQEQAIYGMRLAGIAPAEIARTLDIPPACLESRRAAMLRKLQAPGAG
jgi:DNA-binding NarL/FixJ family response regulator